MLRSEFKNYRPKHRPGKNEVELTMAGMIDSLMQSMDAAYKDRDQTTLSMNETCNASYIITRTEIHHVKKYLDNCNQACLRQKHKAVHRRIALFHSFLEQFPSVITGDPMALESFVKEWVQFMNDAHLLLKEQTPKRERMKILEAAGGDA